jgi:ABC-type antimicrobial peptide transport system permease subunit
MASLAVTLAVLGAVLAALGLYGVLAFDVGQRTREIGIRSALGAVPGRILGLVARTGVGLTALGGLIGLAGAIYLSRFLESRLYGVGRLDISTYAIGGLILLATAVLATWAPARRALRVDPVQALRDD